MNEAQVVDLTVATSADSVQMTTELGFLTPADICTNDQPCPMNEAQVVDLTVATSADSVQMTTELGFLTPADILSTNSWLNDKLIDLGQAMLQTKYPHINGLQSVILAEKFALIPQPDEFVQILNQNGNHWILVSSIGCASATVKVYDSLHGTLSSATKCLVADMLQSKSSEITIQYVDVQWQSNTYDCGLFALANATMLCNGTDPTSVSLDQAKMRKHFLACIESGDLKPFPIRGKRRRTRSPRVEKVGVFCICRLIDDGSQMIQCHSCEEWYHTKCVRVAKTFIKHPSVPWLCNLCK